MVQYGELAVDGSVNACTNELYCEANSIVYKYMYCLKYVSNGVSLYNVISVKW